MVVDVRQPAGLSEFYLCEELQRRIWGTDNPVPAHVLIAGHRNGGLLLMAFEDGKPVGFCFGITGRDGNTTYFYNHMLGVVAEARNRGVGYLLKLKLREHVLDTGLNLIKWTYDPLQSRNAALYIGKLGAICRKYAVNYYGEIRDTLNAGYESDRFIAEWWLDSLRVQRRIENGGMRLKLSDVDNKARYALESRVDGCVRKAAKVKLNLESKMVLVEVPWDIGLVKQLNPKFAVDWRTKTRVVFHEYLSRGYVVVDFAVNEDEKRSFYILSKETITNIMTL
ncbi:MAG: GNAT family N-acetyltransferase [Candidatus Jordarchaeales archaeon]